MTYLRINLLLICAFIVVVCGCKTTRTAFNSLPCSYATGWAIQGQAATKGYRGQAEWFVPATSGQLLLIEAAIQSYGTKTSKINLFLAEDKNGIPGNLIESFPEISCSKTNFVLVKSTKKPELQTGEKYWVCAEPYDETSNSIWFYNSNKLANGFAFERSTWSWASFDHGPSNGAFRIQIRSSSKR